MFSFYKLFFFIPIIFLSHQVSRNRSVLLKYYFQSNVPHGFNVLNNEIFISSGDKIIIFDWNGLFKRQLIFSGKTIYDFKVKRINGRLLFYFPDEQYFYIYSENNFIQRLDYNFDNFQISENGLIFYDFQTSNPKATGDILIDTTISAIGTYNPKNKKFVNFKINVNAKLNMLDSSQVVAWVAYDRVYSFNYKKRRVSPVSDFYEFNGTSQVIGRMNNKYFVNFHEGSDKDYFYVIDQVSEKITIKKVDLDYNDLHSSIKTDFDFQMIHHNGLFYFYDGVNQIYYMRYTKYGCEIGLLSDVLKN